MHSKISMKILVFGGSFDPPHRGHIVALKSGIAFLKPDRTIVLPSFLPKSGLDHSICYQDRLLMTEMALADDVPKGAVELSDFEGSSPTTRGFTNCFSDYLRYLMPRKNEVWFLCGWSTFAELGEWNDPDYIAENCRFLVVFGHGETAELPILNHPFRATLHPIESAILSKPYRISSLSVRATLMSGGHVEPGVLSRSVFRYIRKGGLYSAGS